MRKVVFKKAEVNGNIVFEVDRKKDGWDMMKGVGLWKKMLFSNFRVSRSARLDRYEYVYFLKTNEDQVILERQPCTTRLANSNKTFFVKTTIGFQFVDLRRVRRNEKTKYHLLSAYCVPSLGTSTFTISLNPHRHPMRLAVFRSHLTHGETKVLPC